MGRLAIGFSGAGRVADEVSAELSEGLDASPDAPDLSFEFVDTLPPADYRRNGSIIVSTDGLRVDTRGLLYQPTSDARTLRVKLQIAPLPDRRGLAREISRFRNWNYLDGRQETAKSFMYDVFDWSTQLIQLRLGQSYMHASSMTRDGRTLAVMGWGGVGKTTSLLKLCIEDAWGYLSDDLGLIDDSGMVHRTPKRLQVYGYNTVGQPAILARLLHGRSVLDRLGWEYHFRRHGEKRVRRRVSAQALFGPDRVATGGRLTDLLYLERSSDDAPRLVDIETEEIARRMAAIVMAEIEPYSSLHREAAAAGVTFLDRPADIEQRTFETLRSAFSGVRTAAVRVGPTANPNSLADIIRSFMN
jgi:hypothetical protein